MIGEMLKDMTALMEEKGETSLSGLKGRAADKIVTYKSLGDLPERSAQFDLEKCLDCSDKPCVARCYFGALVEEEGGLKADEDKCTGCSMCRCVCPKDAVTMKEE